MTEPHPRELVGEVLWGWQRHLPWEDEEAV